MATTLACPRCTTAHQTGAVFCSTCGLNLRDPRDRTTEVSWPGGVPAAGPSTSLACPQCGTSYATGAVFCSSCGLDLRDPRQRTTRASRGGEESVSARSGTDTMLARLQQATIGLYDVAAELGRGGMAAVYLAHDLRLARDVAIKVMLAELTTGDDMVERFRREARTAGNLSHPHIIPIYHVHDERGLVFFVMKYVEGRSLDSAVREMGPLPIPMVEAILSQSAAALAYAHRKGVIHRDIKPANIMLDEDGWAVVTDFGIAKMTDATMLTSTGATMGTPYYMSPEQCSSKPVTGASDQYSLGVTTYELLTGHPPFQGASLMEVMGGHFFTPPTAVREKRPDCPPALEAIVMRMLAKEPEQRFATLDEVVSALKAPTLMHDDPTRSQMIDLARSGAKLRERVSVPLSPVPGTRAAAQLAAQAVARRSSSSTQAAAPAATWSARAKPSAPASARRRVGLAVAGLAVAGVIGLGVFQSGVLRTPVEPSSGDLASRSAPDPTAAPVTSPTKPAAAPGTAGDTVARTLTESALTTRVPEKAPSKSSATKATPRAAPAVEPPPIRAETAPTAPSPAPVALDTMGAVLLGSRTPQAFYYVNGVMRDVIAIPRTIPLRAGTVRLSIGAEGCTPWDTTMTISAGPSARLGYRSLVCNAPARP